MSRYRIVAELATDLATQEGRRAECCYVPVDLCWPVTVWTSSWRPRGGATCRATVLWSAECSTFDTTSHTSHRSWLQHTTAAAGKSTNLSENKSFTHTHARAHAFNGPLSGTTRVSRYQKGKTNLDFTEARDSEWQWHQLGCMQVCTSLQTDNHTSTPLLSFLQVGCPSCRPTNSVKALKANL